jgi:hypothetical protein
VETPNSLWSEVMAPLARTVRLIYSKQADAATRMMELPEGRQQPPHAGHAQSHAMSVCRRCEHTRAHAHVHTHAHLSGHT